MKKFIFPLVLALLGIMTSCEDLEGTYPPTWKGFTYTPSPVHPGDSVTITACQAKKGHLLNATDYTFTLKLKLDSLGTTKDTTLVDTYHTNYGGTDNSDPKGKFCLPTNTIPNSYTCYFTAKWSNSADGEMGTYSGVSESGYLGSITSECYTLYSIARGSFNLPIKQ